MTKVGRTTHKFYKETRGLKISGGEFVKAGTILSREGNKWKAGINVGGISTVYAITSGKVFFTRRKGNYRTNKTITVVNIKKEEAKKKTVKKI